MKYLVVGPAWIGDMVMAHSLLRRIKQDDPAAIIDVLAPTFSLPVVRRMAEVNEVIDLPFKHGDFDLKGRRQLGQQLKRNGYDKALILPRALKAAVAPFFAGIPTRVGFSGELRSWMLTDARKRKPREIDGKIVDMTVKRFISLGLSRSDAEQPFEILNPELQLNEANRDQALAKLGLTLDKPVVCICPGAEYGPAKQWPMTSHQALAEQLVEQGYQVWVIGSPKEATAGDEIAVSGHADIHNLCGKTALVDTVDLFGAATAVVSHDSGLMHVAAATGAKTIGIYGSSSPEFTPPLSDNSVVVSQPIDCAPCFKRECPFGHYRCLTEISVTQVLQSID
ncbi:lipopolysaccharide heptosyltransferase II [Ferrimonas lipolytica]|uniref:lipopolysaccharide heptosyltransferase II n=1 Tax=Ferrimonas lipolytica TaxID=2724191 RepID=A0A6H1UIB7_9GAMM|nr:lipopolysaccharide heptosyltransferase II [Ferrimonas lipolytica]QIZ78350.1 lipopolysaccharide heptosyltransferase II [Ferrimonas lipolytica]